jgi:hypothetical protein
MVVVEAAASMAVGDFVAATVGVASAVVMVEGVSEAVVVAGDMDADGAVGGMASG